MVFMQGKIVICPTLILKKMIIRKSKKSILNRLIFQIHFLKKGLQK